MHDNYDLSVPNETNLPEESFDYLMLTFGVKSKSTVLNLVEIFGSAYYNPELTGKPYFNGFVSLDDLLKTLGSESFGVIYLAEALLVVYDAFITLAVF